ncbi:MAG: 3'-5' exonuclease, partial [candidate division WOR-3 bacterium]
PKWGFAEPIKKEFRKYHINYECRPDVEKTGLKILDTARIWLEKPQDNFALREIIEIFIDREKGQGLNKNKISKLWQDVINDNISLWEALQKRSNNDNFLSELYNKLKRLKESREPQEFINIIRPWETKDKFLTEIGEWLEEAQSRESGELVRILTMHGAKGLEADYVFIVGLDKDVFPVVNNEVSQEEQARLLFVSMTRAKRALYLFHARKRSSKRTYHRNSYALKLSPFVKAISTEYISKEYIPAKNR